MNFIIELLILLHVPLLFVSSMVIALGERHIPAIVQPYAFPNLNSECNPGGMRGLVGQQCLGVVSSQKEDKQNALWDHTVLLAIRQRQHLILG